MTSDPKLRPAPAIDGRNFAAPPVLRNGTPILIRAVRPDDKERLRAAFANLERRTIYTRFFGYKSELTEAEVEQAVNVDFDQAVALWATAGSGEAEAIIAGARYVRAGGPGSQDAEVAFIVEEDYQGHGIARCLLDHLIDIARGNGLLWFSADVLPHNEPMLAVFARSGLPMRRQSIEGVVHITLSLDSVPHSSCRVADLPVGKVSS